MGSCAAPSAKGDDKFITTDYLQQCPWVYNSSLSKLRTNISLTSSFYNKEVERLKGNPLAKELIQYDETKISWSSSLIPKVSNGIHHQITEDGYRASVYRPYFKQNLYFDSILIHRVGQMPRIFPNAQAENLVIQATGVGAKEFSVLISDTLPCLDNIEKGQCFPLYLYDEQAAEQADDLFAVQGGAGGLKRRDAITDEGLAHFQEAYPEITITKESLFYYIYGLLHSEDYRTRFADNLSKELPRIPRVKGHEAFSQFVRAGQSLAKLHLEYESVPLYKSAKLTGKVPGLKVDPSQGVLGGQPEDFRVTKMKFGKKRDPETGKSINDKTTVIYNSGITIKDIPEEAYDYVVNGKPALEWVMERQSVTTHKASGITNDANDWAIETMGNPKFPLELFLRVITVALETEAIVNGLPTLEI